MGTKVFGFNVDLLGLNFSQYTAPNIYPVQAHQKFMILAIIKKFLVRVRILNGIIPDNDNNQESTTA